MKKMILLCVSIVLLSAAQIDEFATKMGYHRVYEKALEQAKKEHKVIMLVVVGDYCPWCRKFERKTLEEPMVKEQVRHSFIPVIVDRDLDKANYPKEYYSPRIPTVHFIEPQKQKSILESLGYVLKDEYIKTLNKVLLDSKGALK